MGSTIQSVCQVLYWDINKKGVTLVPKSSWWLRHEERRTHKGGITLDATGKLGPEYLNTWRGFNVAPVEGDPSVFLDHIRMISAGNGEGAADYLTGWLATKVQQPGEQLEVAVVMRGDEGTGKGAIGHTMIRMFGSHAMHVAQPEHLVGKFNSHLMDCCLLFADESFFAGDPRHISVLKALITERTIAIEKKFVDAFQGRNRLGVVMASNSDFVVPAGKDARRFFCLDVPDTRKGDRDYFKRYFNAVNDPAQLGAFLKYLMDYDLSGFEIRDFPQTPMLTDQRISALGVPEKWLLNRLVEGTFRDIGPVSGANGYVGLWPEWLATKAMYNDYQHHMSMTGRARYELNAIQFGKFLGRYYQPLRPRGNGKAPRLHGYALGCLDAARGAFAKYHGLTAMEWEEGDD